jgi:hypothetical protein
MHLSLWDRIEAVANAKYLDQSGLSPWWVLKGAAVSRFVFNLPQSRDLEKFKLLKEQRLIYRLALGQPNQEDLIEFLGKGGPGLSAILAPLALDLSAFSRAELSAARSVSSKQNSDQGGRERRIAADRPQRDFPGADRPLLG